MKHERKTYNLGKEEEYLVRIFSLLKKRENIVFNDKKANFNNTELRLLSEIISANYENRRLISTQLAQMLGVTRSAVSQIVNNLENRGVVRRVADEVDRKIAYIEITEGIIEAYGEDVENCKKFVKEVVEEFGEERFFTMCNAYDEFIALGQKRYKEKNK